MNLDDVIFIDSLPKLDLHGLTREFVFTYVNDFISDSIKLKNDIIVIIHGDGKHILKDETHDILKKDKRIIEYKTYYNNSGCTLVKLSVK